MASVITCLLFILMFVVKSRINLVGLDKRGEWRSRREVARWGDVGNHTGALAPTFSLPSVTTTERMPFKNDSFRYLDDFIQLYN